MKKTALLLSLAAWIYAGKIQIIDQGTPKSYVYFKDYKISEIRKEYRAPQKDEEVTKYYGNSTFWHPFSNNEAGCGMNAFGGRPEDYSELICNSSFTELKSAKDEFAGRLFFGMVTLGVATVAMGTMHTNIFSPLAMKKYLDKSNISDFESLLGGKQDTVVLTDFNNDDFIDDNQIKTTVALPSSDTNVLLLDKETKKWLYVDKSKSSEELVSSWLVEFTKPSALKPVILPAEIAKPTLPPVMTITKDEFETKAQFDGRVAQAMSEREAVIKKLQEQYRKDVEKRNKEVDHLREAYQEEIAVINKEQEAKKEKLKPIAEHYTKLAFLITTGRPHIANPIYDAETQQMYVDYYTTAKSSQAKRIAFKQSPSDAKNLKTNFANATAEATYEYHDNAIEFKAITVKFDGSKYLCSVSQSDFKPEAVRIALEDNKISFDAAEQAKMFALQNPNLVDTYKVSTVRYSESKSLTGQSYTDDLAPLVAKVAQAPIDSKKWLFAIAVEKYDEADPVIYATNSANSFISVMQKRLGIDGGHTYSLLNEKATTGGIKGGLERMLSKVKEGDSIYFYYSGHGIPDPVQGEPYILPRDVIADYVVREKELMARSIYKKLSDSSASRIIAFVDSCYSGRTDGVSNIKGAAAGHFKSKTVEFDTEKMAVFTAGTNGQFSNAFPEKGNRLFSYYLVKALATKENLDLDTLSADVYANVKEESLKMGDIKRQEPQIEGNRGIGLR